VFATTVKKMHTFQTKTLTSVEDVNSENAELSTNVNADV
jgi:hypothetical protein